MRNETIHVGFRFPIKDWKLLQKVAQGRGEKASNFVRTSTRIQLARLGYLSAEEKKALGVLDGEN